MSYQLEFPFEDRGEDPKVERSEETSPGGGRALEHALELSGAIRSHSGDSGWDHVQSFDANRFDEDVHQVDGGSHPPSLPFFFGWRSGSR